METASHVSPESPKQNIFMRIISGAMSELRRAREQLANADLNPHEGRLRGSQMDAKYMNIPDSPPIHDGDL